MLLLAENAADQRNSTASLCGQYGPSTSAPTDLKAQDCSKEDTSNVNVSLHFLQLEKDLLLNRTLHSQDGAPFEASVEGSSSSGCFSSTAATSESSTAKAATAATAFDALFKSEREGDDDVGSVVGGLRKVRLAAASTKAI